MGKAMTRRDSSANPRASAVLDLTENALTVLENRYLNRDDAGNIIETPEELFRRVARSVAEIEKRWSAREEECRAVEDQYYDIMARGQFMPNSPTLMNAGRRLGMLSACFVLPLEDSIPGIMETARQIALVQRAGGGTGVDLSALRPRGSIVRSSGGTTEGPLSFLRMLSGVTDAIQQGAFRRGANMGMMRIDHPDIIGFIRTKEDLTKITNYNLSVSMTDDFMQRLRTERDAPHVVLNPLDGREGYLRRDTDSADYAPVKDGPLKDGSAEYWSVGQLWDLITLKAWESGEPGLIFIDEVNRKNQTPHVFKIVATNPCGEQPLGPYEACNLGSINLAKFLRSGGNGVSSSAADRVDWEGLAEKVRLAVRFLDDVVEVNSYPTPEIHAACHANRKIGLGVMGWADVLFRLGIPYDSEAALELSRRMGEFLQRTAWDSDTELAEKRGVFPNWKGSVWDVVHHRKMRNAHCITIAPTGTISIIAGCSGGIEPIFSLAFTRQVLDGKKLMEVNPIFRESLQRYFEGDEAKIEQVIEHAAQHGTLQGLDLPDPLKQVFRTARDIAPEWHVRMQAAWQEYTDAAVSKCVAEGTLVWSEHGLVPIEELAPAGGRLEPDSFVARPTRLFSDQGSVEAREIYFGGRQRTVRLVTRTGFWLEGTPNHRIRVLGPAADGRRGNGLGDRGVGDRGVGGEIVWRPLGELRRGDEVVLQVNQDYWGSTIDLPAFTRVYQDECPGLTLPRRLSTDVAWLLGALLHEDRTVFHHNGLDIVEPDDAMRGRIRGVMSDIFHLEPLEIPRPEAPCLRYTSMGLKAFLVDCIGLCPIWNLREVPSCIRRAPAPQVIAFLEGLLGGRLDKGQQLHTVSEKLAHQVQLLLLNAGHVAALQHDETGYALRLRPEFLASLKARTRRLLAAAGGEVEESATVATTAAQILLDPIAHLEEAMASVWDFHVPETHSFTAGGFINHNTINLPANAEPADVEAAYLLAHELKCKGITVYRDGSRPTQPMALKGARGEVFGGGALKPARGGGLKGKEKKAERSASAGPEVASDGTIRPMKLPEIMPCVRVRQFTPFGNMHVKISVEPQTGLEREVFAQLGKGGDVANSDLEAVCRILSLFLRCNGSIKAAVNQLEGIGSSLSVPSKEGRIMSLADGLAAAVKKYLYFKERYGLHALLLGEVDLSERVETNGNHHGNDLQYAFKVKCPACNGVLAFEEGCVKCHTCGFSQC
ncbi:MAG: adenosylcobalamin-dependent ribonucleoside-diphosphate reductase [Planctomycetota bacterium]